MHDTMYYDIVALGEVLIDFTPIQHEPHSFKQNAGGAPANVLAMLAKLNKKTAFIGKVGNDQFGHFLNDTLQEAQIDTTGLVFSDDVRTTLAFVHLSTDGDRSFSFYRNPGADMTLTKNEVKTEIIEQATLFHFGSLSLTDDTVAEATFHALEVAKQKHKLISYDPNLRANLWSSLEHAKTMILKGLYYAHIAKVSEEELLFLTGMSQIEEASTYLFETYQLNYLFVTLGADGCYFKSKTTSGHVPAFPVNVVDTTAAGDSFFGAMLYQLLQASSRETLTETDLREMVRFANATGALTTTNKGAIASLPSLVQIEALLATQK